MIIYAVLVLLSGILFWRIVLPNMRLTKSAKGNGGVPPAQGNTSVQDRIVEWFKSNPVTILLTLAGLAIIGFGLYSSLLGSPSLAGVVRWSRDHWLWLILLWGVVAALVALNTTGAVAKTLQWVLALAVFALFIVLPLLLWLGFGDEKKPVQPQAQQLRQQPAAECTTQHPCVPRVQADGSTERVSVPSGKDVCFDLTFWGNIGRLGYKTSYQGIETEYQCTREQVLSGTCIKQDMDHFRFTPEAGVGVPRHWFVPRASQC